MVLHERYFDNLARDAGGEISSSSALGRAIGESFGDIETWKRDFTAIGGMREVGWAVTYLDPATGRLSNHWITLHQDGNIAVFTPVVVMDVWEHAFLLDYKPADWPRHIEAFMSNLDVATCEARLIGKANRPVGPTRGRRSDRRGSGEGLGSSLPGALGWAAGAVEFPCRVLKNPRRS